jgi:hypothetical protein
MNFWSVTPCYIINCSFVLWSTPLRVQKIRRDNFIFMIQLKKIWFVKHTLLLLPLVPHCEKLQKSVSFLKLNDYCFVSTQSWLLCNHPSLYSVLPLLVLGVWTTYNKIVRAYMFVKLCLLAQKVNVCSNEHQISPLEHIYTINCIEIYILWFIQPKTGSECIYSTFSYHLITHYKIYMYLTELIR